MTDPNAPERCADPWCRTQPGGGCGKTPQEHREAGLTFEMWSAASLPAASLAVIADVADAVDPALPEAKRNAAAAKALATNPALAAEYAISMLTAVLASVDEMLKPHFEEPSVAAHWMREIRARGGRVRLDGSEEVSR